MPFVFNIVELCVVTINEKPWTRARKVCKVLDYVKPTKVTDVLRHLCSKTNYGHKWQLTRPVSETKPADWPIDPQKYDIYTNEEAIHEIVFSSQQPKAKDFRRHCCNVLLPHVREQLAKKKKNKMKEHHEQAIEEKDAVITLMNDDLQDRDNQIQAIKYENVALQAKRDVYQAELQRCQDIITHLKTHYVPHARYSSKDNIIIIVWKHAKPANDKYHGLPYYIATIQRHKRYVKLRWFDRHFTDHEVIVEIDNPNSIHGFNRFEEEGHAERKYNHFRLIDLTREELHAMGVPAILDDEEE